MDRKLMIWDILKTIIAAPTDQNGTLFIAFDNKTGSERKFRDAKDKAHITSAPIVDSTITFDEIKFTRCDKFFAHSGEIRNATHNLALTGVTAPFFTALMSETISLVNNTADHNIMYFLVISLKRSETSSDSYLAQQTWLMKCYSCEIISIYSANMLKYGVIGECMSMEHKLSKRSIEESGNFDCAYGIESNKNIDPVK